MGYFRITPKAHRGMEYVVKAPRGSQIMYDEIERIVGEKPHPLNGIPFAMEVDGWADDLAYPGCAPYETEDFIVECITDFEYFKEL